MMNGVGGVLYIIAKKSFVSDVILNQNYVYFMKKEQRKVSICWILLAIRRVSHSAKKDAGVS